MATLQSAIRETVSDRSVWLLTAFLLAWYVVGVYVPDTNPLHVLMQPIFGVMLVYLVSLGQFLTFGGEVVYWLGFALFCFVIAGVIVATGKWISARFATNSTR